MPYLRETLASLVEQTYRDASVLAWDNGSTDGSIEELKEWIPAQIPGRIIEGNPMSLGCSLAAMVDLAETEYCARIDADDVSEPERLDCQIAFLDKFPDCAVVGSQVSFIKACGMPGEKVGSLPMADEDIVNRMLSKWALWHPTVLFRRNTIINAGNYRDFTPGQDYDLWYRVAMLSKLANLPEALVRYRTHDASVTTLTAKQRSGFLDFIFSQHAHALFNLTDKEALNLRKREVRCSISLLFRTARKLKQRHGRSLIACIRQPSFIEAWKILVSPNDYATRLLLFMIGNSPTQHVMRMTRFVRSRLINSHGNLPFC